LNWSLSISQLAQNFPQKYMSTWLSFFCSPLISMKQQSPDICIRNKLFQNSKDSYFNKSFCRQNPKCDYLLDFHDQFTCVDQTIRSLKSRLWKSFILLPRKKGDWPKFKRFRERNHFSTKLILKQRSFYLDIYDRSYSRQLKERFNFSSASVFHNMRTWKSCPIFETFSLFPSVAIHKIIITVLFPLAWRYLRIKGELNGYVEFLSREGKWRNLRVRENNFIYFLCLSFEWI
jgi:hypothetical protein